MSFENFTENIDFDISKLSMEHFFPAPIKIKKINFNDIGLNISEKALESEPKLVDFSHFDENQQQEAKDLLKVQVNSDFNNFDGYFELFYFC